MPKDYFPNLFYTDFNPLFILIVRFDVFLTDSYPMFMCSKGNFRNITQLELVINQNFFIKHRPMSNNKTLV